MWHYIQTDNTRSYESTSLTFRRFIIKYYKTFFLRIKNFLFDLIENFRSKIVLQVMTAWVCHMLTSLTDGGGFLVNC